ncbi:MAG: ABC transporter ATP-binding protein [Nitrospinae bacterium]|nr:ABC transporter ATP-binding protein [Nitrospinota bacterium]
MSLLDVKNLKTFFPLNSGILGKSEYFKAVNDVSFTVNKGDTYSIVGESGSGKSTIGKSILRLINITSGTIIFDGKDITSIEGEELRLFRENLQIIFQDPFSSLNPRHKVKDIVTEPLIIFNRIKKNEIEKQATELMKKVGLPAEAIHKYSHQFSGGQRQRIGIARAISLKPRLIVCDEPVSALDVSIQAQILNLMMDLKEELDLSYIFISHDLAVVENISDYVAVMYAGRLMETGEKNAIFNNPLHPYTKLLLSSVPEIKKEKKEKIKETVNESFAEEKKTSINNASFCPFYKRCPEAMTQCKTAVPEMKEIEKGHSVSCFLME